MRLGILISGRGSNFEAIANAIARRKLDAEIAIVISNRAQRAGLDIARQRGIPMRVIESRGMEREAYDKLVIDELRTHEVDLVCLAGFMRLLSASFRSSLSRTACSTSTLPCSRRFPASTRSARRSNTA